MAALTLVQNVGSSALHNRHDSRQYDPTVLALHCSCVSKGGQQCGLKAPPGDQQLVQGCKQIAASSSSRSHRCALAICCHHPSVCANFTARFVSAALDAALISPAIFVVKFLARWCSSGGDCTQRHRSEGASVQRTTRQVRCSPFTQNTQSSPATASASPTSSAAARPGRGIGRKPSARFPRFEPGKARPNMEMTPMQVRSLRALL